MEMSWSFILSSAFCSSYFIQTAQQFNKQTKWNSSNKGAEGKKTFPQVDGNLPKSLAVFDFLMRLLRERIKFQFCPFCPAWKQTKHFSLLFSCAYPRRNGCAFVGKDKQNDVNEDLHVPLLLFLLLTKYHRSGCGFFVILNGGEKVGHNVWVSGAHRFQQRFFFIVND